MAWVTSSKRQRDKSLCSQFKHWELVSFPWAEVKWKKNKRMGERGLDGTVHSGRVRPGVGLHSKMSRRLFTFDQCIHYALQLLTLMCCISEGEMRKLRTVNVHHDKMLCVSKKECNHTHIQTRMFSPHAWEHLTCEHTMYLSFFNTCCLINWWPFSSDTHSPLHLKQQRHCTCLLIPHVC